eukprot:36896-Eustigmatos_ZCMA.PRE.1
MMWAKNTDRWMERQSADQWSDAVSDYHFDLEIVTVDIRAALCLLLDSSARRAAVQLLAVELDYIQIRRKRLLFKTAWRVSLLICID